MQAGLVEVADAGHVYLNARLLNGPSTKLQLIILPRLASHIRLRPHLYDAPLEVVTHVHYRLICLVNTVRQLDFHIIVVPHSRVILRLEQSLRVNLSGLDFQGRVRQGYDCCLVTPCLRRANNHRLLIRGLYLALLTGSSLFFPSFIC